MNSPLNPHAPMYFPVNQQAPVYFPLNPRTPMYFPVNPQAPMYGLVPVNQQIPQVITITEFQLKNRESHREFMVKRWDYPFIHVTVTSSATAVDQWINQTVDSYMHNLLSRLLVGLGVLWFTIDDAVEPADTLQLCVGDRCLIFQLSQADTVPKSLRDFLMDQRITFVGICNGEHKKSLLNSKHQLEINDRVFDLRFSAKDNDGNSLQDASASNIRQQCLGLGQKVLSLKRKNHYWGVVDLSLRQVKFACVDAYASYVLGMRVRAWEF